MKTLVFQSCRASPPCWLERCLDSVKAWARTSGHAYQCYGDELLELVPQWFRDASDHRVVTTDLGRLLLARQHLEQEWDVTIWVDADVLVCDPEQWRVSPRDAPEGYLLCREVWVYGDPHSNDFRASRRVNNAVLGFVRGNAFLPFYIDACMSIAKNNDRPLHKLAVGPHLLTALHADTPTPLIGSVATLSALMMADIVSNTWGQRAVIKHAEQMGQPVYAAHLCASLAGATFFGTALGPPLYEQVIDRLVQDRGACLNPSVS